MVIERDKFGNDISNLPKFETYTPSAFESYSPSSQAEPERTLGGTLADVGVSIGKGIVGAGQGIVGLADLATPGNLGQGLENIGLDLSGWQEDLSEMYTPIQQKAFEEVAAAKGFLPTLGKMIQRPSTIGHGIVETIPSMAAGGVIGRGLGLAAKGLGATSKAIPLVTGAAGEGAITAGQTQEAIRQQSGGETTFGQKAKAVGAGLGTSVLGVVGGKIAQRFGLSDVDTMLAGGQFAEKSNKGVIRRILEGGISEGAFEELPQSIQEQVWTNAALGRDLTEGIGEAGAAGRRHPAGTRAGHQSAAGRRRWRGGGGRAGGHRALGRPAARGAVAFALRGAPVSEGMGARRAVAARAPHVRAPGAPGGRGAVPGVLQPGHRGGPAPALLLGRASFQPRVHRPPDPARLCALDRAGGAGPGRWPHARRGAVAGRCQLRKRRVRDPGALGPEGPWHRLAADADHDRVRRQHRPEAGRRPGAARERDHAGDVPAPGLPGAPGPG